MIYGILFNKTAAQLKSERNVKHNGLLRDYFTKSELELVDEFETIVTGLLSLGFSEIAIQQHLQNKFDNMQQETA